MGKFTITPDDRQRLEAELKGKLPAPDSQAFEDLLTKLDVSNPDLALEIRNALRLVGLPSALQVQGAKAKEDAQIAQFIKRLFYKDTPDGPVQDKGKITRAAIAVGLAIFSVGALGAVLKPAKPSSLNVAALAGNSSPKPMSAELPNGNKPLSTSAEQSAAINSDESNPVQKNSAQNGLAKRSTDGFPSPNMGKTGVKTANNPKTVNYEVMPGSSMASSGNDGRVKTAQSNSSNSLQGSRSSNSGSGYLQSLPYSSGQPTRMTANGLNLKATTSSNRTKPTATKTQPSITASLSIKSKTSSLVKFSTTKVQTGVSGLKTGYTASTNRPSSGGFSLGSSGSTKSAQTNSNGLRISPSPQTPVQEQFNSVAVNSTAQNRPSAPQPTVGTVNVSGNRQAIQQPRATGINVNSTGNRQAVQKLQTNININNATSAQTAQGSPQTGSMVSSTANSRARSCSMRAIR